jgi:hypothetical protein
MPEAPLNRLKEIEQRLKGMNLTEERVDAMVGRSRLQPDETRAQSDWVQSLRSNTKFRGRVRRRLER